MGLYRSAGWHIKVILSLQILKGTKIRSAKIIVRSTPNLVPRINNFQSKDSSDFFFFWLILVIVRFCLSDERQSAVQRSTNIENIDIFRTHHTHAGVFLQPFAQFDCKFRTQHEPEHLHKMTRLHRQSQDLQLDGLNWRVTIVKD